jgi:hypothetical protein
MTENGQMFFVRLEAMPSEAIATRDGVVGAFVNCWVATDDAEEAESVARNSVQEAGWHVVRIEALVLVLPEEEREPEEAERIQEALEHGGTMVFYEWGHDDEPIAG